MNAEILCVGTEILLGDIVNTNAAYIAQGLATLGINCYQHTAVGDNPERLKQSLNEAFSRCNLVIMTGGLGPTYDDLTKETVAEFFGAPIVLDAMSEQMLLENFKRIGRPMTENNRKQAFMPQGAHVFPNDRGTANGLALEKNGKIAILMPGPPREMTAMFDLQVKPFLAARSSTVLVSKNIHFFGIGESQLEQTLHEYMLDHSNPTVAPYAKEGEVRLRITASASNEKQAEELLEPVVREICEMFPEYVYGVDVESLENLLVKELLNQKLHLATAESCTGGMISASITSISGASLVFDCGVCSYSNDIKHSLLQVNSQTLEVYGAVSSQTALEMAQGVRKLAGADIGLSVTGIAGPTGGTEEKPVGLVYIGVSSPWREDVVELRLNRNYGGGRDYIRNIATKNALYLALETVKKYS